MYYITLSNYSTVEGHLGCFQCLAILWIKMLWTSVYRFLGKQKSLFLWDKCSEVQLLRSMVGERLVFLSFFFFNILFILLCKLYPKHGAWTHDPEVKSCMHYWLSQLGVPEYTVFKETVKLFLEWPYHLTFPPAMYEWPSFSISLPAFGVVTFLNFSHSDGRIVISHGGLKLHFPNSWLTSIF